MHPGHGDLRSGGDGLVAEAFGPEAGELELDLFEGGVADLGVAVSGAEQGPEAGLGVEAVDLDVAGLDRDEPEVADTFAGVDMKLERAVADLGARREDLADPVGSKGDKGGRGRLGESREAPSGEVGNEDGQVVGGTEMQLGLVEDEPAVGRSATTYRASEVDAELGRGALVCDHGPGLEVELAVHDLGDEVGRRVEDVLVGGASCEGSGGVGDHGLSLVGVVGEGNRGVARPAR